MRYDCSALQRADQQLYTRFRCAVWPVFALTGLHGVFCITDLVWLLSRQVQGRVVAFNALETKPVTY